MGYLYEKNIRLLKLYCSSRFIKKEIKLKIFKKLVKEDLISESKLLTLADLQEIIEMTDDRN